MGGSALFEGLLKPLLDALPGQRLCTTIAAPPLWRGGLGRIALAGEALVLLSGGGGNDDDKTRTSPVLWRLPPWQRMHRLSGAPGDWHDHRRGHARRGGQHATYVFEHVRPELRDVFTTHARSWVVVYGDGPRQRFLTELKALGAPAPVRVGDDHLLIVVPDP